MRPLFPLIALLAIVPISSVIICKGQAMDSSLSLYFKTNSSTLNQQSRKQLNQWLAENKPPIQLSLKGFTDTTGGSEYNRRLSMERAKAVAGFIKNNSANYGFAMVQGLGEDSLPDRTLLWQNRKVVLAVERNPVPFEPVKITTTENSNRRLKGALQQVNKALDNIYFEPDKPVVEEESFYYLKDLADALLQYPPATTFEIVGHVNCMGKHCSNPKFMKVTDELSVARAKEIYLHLIDRGLVAERLSYKGVGSRNMQYPNARTEAEMRKNMRVEIIIH